MVIKHGGILWTGIGPNTPEETIAAYERLLDGQLHLIAAGSQTDPGRIRITVAVAFIEDQFVIAIAAGRIPAHRLRTANVIIAVPIGVHALRGPVARRRCLAEDQPIAAAIGIQVQLNAVHCLATAGTAFKAD